MAIGGAETQGGGYRLPLMLAIAATGLAAVSALLLWPGIAAFDTVVQYQQALAGVYDDWHPPIMARLWAVLIALHAGGTGAMLLIQLGLYWAGLAMIGIALERTGARRAAWAAVLAGLSPLVLDWMVVIVKDAQMIGAMVAAIGIVVWYRLPGRRLPWPAVVLVALLLGYAVLVRANAVFAVAPLGLALMGWGGVRWRIARAGLLLLLSIGLAILVSDVVNHRLIGAERSHVERTLPLFDLAGIAHDAPLPTVPGLPPEQWAKAERIGCYTPFYWDMFGDPARCGAMGDMIVSDDISSIEHRWIVTIAAHPIAYAEHRLAHLNSTLRIVTPASEPSAAAPLGSQPNPYRLGLPATRLSRAVQAVAAAIAETPIGVPAVWLILAIGLGWTLQGTARQPARDIGLALALSACLMTASFAVVSIASDLRYHLWLMMGTALAAVMLAGCHGIDRRRLRITLLLTAAACLASIVARAYGAPIRH